jgi:hypothetical protein
MAVDREEVDWPPGWGLMGWCHLGVVAGIWSLLVSFAVWKAHFLQGSA